MASDMRNSFNFHRLIVAALLFPAALLTHAKAPTIDPADDANHLAHTNGIRSWTAHQQVAGFRNIDRLWNVREIHAGDSPQRLPQKLTPLGSVEFQANDQKLTLDEYFERQNVAGLLVIKDGRILYERYGLGNTEHSKWVSFSVAKSVVSMLIGAAIKDGYIESVDEKVTDYLPRLKNSPYAQITIRDVLQMSSGVLWNEDYADPEADINRVPWHALLMHRYVSTLKLGHKPGKTFNYNTAESRIAGNLLRAAIGNNLSTYLTKKVWQPFGMESDANWALTGGPAAGTFPGHDRSGGFHATRRRNSGGLRSDGSIRESRNRSGKASSCFWASAVRTIPLSRIQRCRTRFSLPM